MITQGRVCVKIAGRDAGKHCVVLDVVDDHTVLIDGATRRRKCNIAHLEPTVHVIDIKKNTIHEDIREAFGSLGITIPARKAKK